jgi:hypothetical protein
MPTMPVTMIVFEDGSEIEVEFLQTVVDNCKKRGQYKDSLFTAATIQGLLDAIEALNYQVLGYQEGDN